VSAEDPVRRPLTERSPKTRSEGWTAIGSSPTPTATRLPPGASPGTRADIAAELAAVASTKRAPPRFVSSAAASWATLST
jgi:hypothetical protein